MPLFVASYNRNCKKENMQYVKSNFIFIYLFIWDAN